jgi:farnesyl diphosphate synthase
MRRVPTKGRKVLLECPPFHDSSERPTPRRRRRSETDPPMTASPTLFETRLAADAAAIEAMLDTLLTETPRSYEIARPPRLLAAMRHAVLGGGKRLRPFLTIEAARLFGVEGDAVLRAATAVELVHCYSLVHDDLPQMDDDDLRRGRPTVHRAFDEATAILVGDALQTLAFELLADPATHPDPVVRADLVLRLARASGLGGMVGGQMFDLAAEGRWTVDGRPEALGDAEIRRLQAMKTGALLRWPLEAGAIFAGAGVDDVARLGRFGAIVGLAFQIADDLLDVEASSEAMGKATGKDAARGKGTLVALHGVAAMRAELARLVEAASAELAIYGPRAETLAAAARFIAERES